MASTSERVLYTMLRKVDLPATLQENTLLPRYTQFGRKKEDYVGLREEAMEAWTSRVLSTDREAQPGEFAMIQVTFTALGFMTYATESYSPNQPRLQKATYYGDKKEYGAWRFYGGIPLHATHPHTSELLVRVEALNWDFIQQ